MQFFVNFSKMLSKINIFERKRDFRGSKVLPLMIFSQILKIVRKINGKSSIFGPIIDWKSCFEVLKAFTSFRNIVRYHWKEPLFRLGFSQESRLPKQSLNICTGRTFDFGTKISIPRIVNIPTKYKYSYQLGTVVEIRSAEYFH